MARPELLPELEEQVIRFVSANETRLVAKAVEAEIRGGYPLFKTSLDVLDGAVVLPKTG